VPLCATETGLRDAARVDLSRCATVDIRMKDVDRGRRSSQSVASRDVACGFGLGSERGDDGSGAGRSFEKSTHGATAGLVFLPHGRSVPTNSEMCVDEAGRTPAPSSATRSRRRLDTSRVVVALAVVRSTNRVRTRRPVRSRPSKGCVRVKQQNLVEPGSGSRESA